MNPTGPSSGQRFSQRGGAEDNDVEGLEVVGLGFSGLGGMLFVIELSECVCRVDPSLFH